MRRGVLIANVVRRYLVNVLLGFDQLGNALLAGDPDETISSRAAKARAKRKAWGCVLCALLDGLDRDHCDRSLERDEGKRRVRQVLREWAAGGAADDAG